MAIRQARGRVNFLRVHDVGSGWGPPHDFIDVEVVIKKGKLVIKPYDAGAGDADEDDD